jgi:hypothetical protein
MASPEKISALPSASALAGTEPVPCVQSSTTVQTTAQSIANLTTFVAPRVTNATSSSTPTPNAGTTDIYTLTALAAAATFGAPSGSPVDGQKLIIRIFDNGTSQTLAWNSAYNAGGNVLPTATVVGKWLYLGFMYNTNNSKWDFVAPGNTAGF